VRLSPSTAWASSALERVVDYYLHSPALAVPIQPFHVISERLAGEGHTTLWAAFGEVLGTNYTIDRARRVSLGRRWLDRGRAFGTADDPIESYERSALWQHVAGLRHRLLAALGQCATCRHFLYCEGYFAALEPSAPPCAAWRVAFDRLADALAAAEA
jgi:hypothetical protein